MSGPLAGIRVIDAGQVVAGPFVASLLADFGADVIKIEEPGAGDPFRKFGPTKEGVPLSWKWLSRNKRSITLNLREERGQELFRDLVRVADVVVQSFRPQTIRRYGLTYEQLAEVNPRIVVVLVSGFGQDGPYSDRPGFGTLAEAMSGYAAITGEEGGAPLLPQFPLADTVAGLYGALGAMNALYWRDTLGGGIGQCIDVSLLESLFAVLGPIPTLYDQLGFVPPRIGSRSYMNAPRNVYRTSDDGWVAIAGSVQSIVARLFRAIDRPELLENPRFASSAARVANMDEVDQIVGDWVRRHTREEAMRILLEHEVASAPVLDVSDLMTDPHMTARGAIPLVEDPDLGSVRMPGIFPLLSRTPGSIAHTGPSLGQHNEDVYVDLLGLTRVELAELKEAGIV